MLFNSLDFLVFFLVVFALYLVLPHRAQNAWLLFASYFFYGWWDWRFLSLIALSTVLDYVAGLGMASTEDTRKRKAWLLLSVALNLGILGFFKYFNFFADSLVELLGQLGVALPVRHLNIILPVGISFYTFQTMSYTIDIYRREMHPTRNLLDFATFVAFFPQLVAGPIERASRLLPQIAQKRSVTWTGIQSGFWLISWGLFKKVVIADNLSRLVEPVFNGVGANNLGQVWVGLYAFAFQIYCDFSGYSDMARGLARCMGIELMVNFNNPYFAMNPSDFWKRWHISLSTWLRDYLYIPLGGNRKGIKRTGINLALTMILGGLWHGAAWTYVCWGVFHGALLIAHRCWSAVWPSPNNRLVWGRRALMFHAVCLGWLFFRASSLGQVASLLEAMRTVSFQGTGLSLVLLVLLCWPLWLVQGLQMKAGGLEAPLALSWWPRSTLYAVMLLMLALFASTGGQAFIYFQF